MASPHATSIDPSKINIRDDAWELVEVTEDFVRHRAVLERHADGTVLYVYRTQPRGLQKFFEDNRRRYEDSANQRFGDGKVVGSIPLNVLYQADNVRHLKEGDQDWLKWFLNHPDNRHYRTFRGKV